MAHWDQYVDSTIVYCKKACDEAVLVGMNGAIWTPWQDECGNAKQNSCTPILKITAQEALKIANNFSKNQTSEFHGSGVTVGGIKYQFLKEDDNVIYAKKKDNGCVTLQKCKQVIVIAHTKEGEQVGDVNLGVARICEYLESVGF